MAQSCSVAGSTRHGARPHILWVLRQQLPTDMAPVAEAMQHRANWHSWAGAAAGEYRHWLLLFLSVYRAGLLVLWVLQVH